MATEAKARKLSKAETTIVLTALDMLAKSQERAARAATGDAVRAAYVEEAGRTQALRNVFTTGELEI